MRVTDQQGARDADAAVGDILRRRADDREGIVSRLQDDGEWIYLDLYSGDRVADHPTDLYYNWWDLKLG